MTALARQDADATVKRVQLLNHLQVLGMCWVAYTVDLVLSRTGHWGYAGDLPLRITAVVLGALLIARMASLRRVGHAWEVTGFAALALTFLVHALVSVLALGLSAATLLSSAMWLYLVYVYAFYVLERGTAVVFTGATWTTATLAMAWLGVTGGSGEPGLSALVQFQGGGLLAIMLAAVLSGWRRALDRAQQRVVEAERRSLTDLLTDQPNRRALQLEIHREMARSRRTGSPFAFLLLDLDHFKRLNDVHGHAVGDAVLMELARVVRSSLRAGDELGRWGGEEFVVIAPEAGPQAAMNLAERIRVRLVDHAWPVGRVTASIGVTVFRAGDALEHLFKRADDALYRAKELGRNRCELELAPVGGRRDGAG